jgi:hypothetical protein
VPLSAFVPAVADACLRVLVPAALAALLLWIQRRRLSAPLEHAVWSAVLIGMLLMPFVSPLLPAISWRVLPPETEARAVTIASKSAASEVQNIPTGWHRLPRSADPQRAFASDWRVWAGGLYLAVAFGFIARIGLGYWLARRLSDGAQQPNDPLPRRYLATSSAEPGCPAHFCYWNRPA